MPRFVTATKPIHLDDPATDAPMMGPPLTWADGIRALFRDVDPKGYPRATQLLDVFGANDLRAKLIATKPGEVAELSDGEWHALAELARHPCTLNPAVIYSGRAFFEAILEAPKERPKTDEAPKKAKRK